MEVSFSKEVELLRLGRGDTFHGEGILAITKALLQSGVAYVGGYQGAPVSHLLDVMVQAEPYMRELGVHVQACANEASAAAMLGASIHYPLRGAVTWKSIVGTNVAADALSNLSSPGVTGGALIVVGEDYGEGASVIQERTHAYALKSSMLMLDPRPELGNMVRIVEAGFALSEASNMPALLELRIRACHVRGTFECRDNVAPALSTMHTRPEPARFDYARLAHPPVTFGHEKLKVEQRIPAAQRYIAAHGLNEIFEGTGFGGERAEVGVIVQGGLHNVLMRSLQQLGLADAFGASALPVLALNVTFPLVPEQLTAFCAGKRAVFVIEEGQPDYIERDILATLHRGDVPTRLHGKDLMPATGEVTVEGLTAGLAAFAERHLPQHATQPARDWLAANAQRRGAVAQRIAQATGAPLPARPPTFCVGCPERPVFAALKLAQQDVGPVHVAADIGCHAFATFEPFSSGHSILGYGMSLASSAGVAPMQTRRVLSVMGDGGFWHNGLLTGVQSALFNGDDSVLLIMKNGYTSATGTQDILSTPSDDVKARAPDKQQSLVDRNTTIESTLTGMGVQWMRTVHTYRVAQMRKTLDEAFTTAYSGLKVIIAEGECQLERQRRVKPWIANLLKTGKRVARVRYGVDEDVCNGDHACIRLSGCPTLTLKDNPDPLKLDPVATVIDGCVGCGLCGENAHAATLCPSFYRAEVVTNATRLERIVDALRAPWRRWLQLAPSDASAALLPLPLAGEGRGEGRDVGGPPPSACGPPSPYPLPEGEGMHVDRPITILVCALGGEGGGVLAEWLVDTAIAAGHSVQSTSIPGVAQRTGATTYYIEVFPRPDAELNGRKPVFSLTPVPGALDLLVSSELLETARQIGNGHASRERTHVISSSGRTLTTAEKMQLADGRAPADVLIGVLREHSARADLLDMAALAQAAGTVISAVLFGAIAASGALPFARDAYRQTIRAGGRGADASLRGFDAAFDALTTQPRERAAVRDAVVSATAPGWLDAFPESTHELIALGHARVLEYQDARYAHLYVERLTRVLAAERAGDPGATNDHATTRETARHLALWMAFDDLVRVAELKCRASRHARVRAEVRAGAADLLRIHDHFKPGVAEVASLLPASLADALVRWERRRVARGRAALALPLKLPSHSVIGLLALRALVALKPLRPRGSRYAAEQALIERWLGAVERGARADAALGHELAQCGRLIKGYGATQERGKENLLHVIEHLAGAAAFETPQTRAVALDAIAAARRAALADDAGTALDRTLAQHGAPPRPVRAQPVRWVRTRPGGRAGDRASQARAEHDIAA